MAVIFISPQKRQREFFIAITIFFALILILISTWAFLSQPSGPETEFVLNKPKINVNFQVLESDQFKNLEPFEMIPLQFSYTAVTSWNKTVTGLISAVSQEEARALLQESGYQVRDLKEVGTGRDNPFEPY